MLWFLEFLAMQESPTALPTPRALLPPLSARCALLPRAGPLAGLEKGGGKGGVRGLGRAYLQPRRKFATAGWAACACGRLAWILRSPSGRQAV